MTEPIRVQPIELLEGECRSLERSILSTLGVNEPISIGLMDEGDGFASVVDAVVLDSEDGLHFVVVVEANEPRTRIVYNSKGLNGSPIINTKKADTAVKNIKSSGDSLKQLSGYKFLLELVQSELQTK